jgi:hypothetical protein
MPTSSAAVSGSGSGAAVPWAWSNISRISSGTGRLSEQPRAVWTAAEPPLGFHQPPQVGDDPVELGPDPDALVGFRGRPVHRGMQFGQPVGYTALGPSIGQVSQVRVGADFHTPAHGVGDHVEEPRVHHRLAEALELEVGQPGELVDQACESVEVHERRRAMRRAFSSELDRTHPAAEVAVPDRFNLEEGRQWQRRPRRGRRNESCDRVVQDW